MLNLGKLFRRRDRARDDDQWFEFWREDDAERFTPDLWSQIEPHLLPGELPD